MQNASKLRKVIVTGANKGIGYEIVKGLYSDADRYHIVLTSRNIKLGEQARNRIQEEVQNSNNIIEVKQLEVNDVKSVDAFVTWAQDSLQEIDVLVNNAGYGYKKTGVEESVLTLNTNFFAVVDLTEKILPILSSDGKVIQVSSGAGNLKSQGENIKAKLNDANLTREELMGLASELLDKTKELKQTSLGWNELAYQNSKCLLNAYTRWILPRMLKTSNAIAVRRDIVEQI